LTRFTAFLDACVLVPVSLTDTLLRLADRDLFRPLWSQPVLDEATDALSHVRPAELAGMHRRVAAMNAHFPDALVQGWESLVTGIVLPDPDDRHVVAAALRGGADGTAVRPTAARRPPAAALGRWRRPMLAAGSVLAAGVVVVGGLTVGRGEGGADDDTVEVDPTTTTACVALRYRPCGAAAAPGTDGRRCIGERVDLDDDPADGCEAVPDGLADGTVLEGELSANLVPADDVDTYVLDVDDGFQVLCDGRITLTLTAPPATTMRLMLLDPDDEVRGEAVSADGLTGELVFRERDCGGDEGGTYAVTVSLVAGSAPSAEDYTLTESGSL